MPEPMTRDDVYREFSKGEDRDGFYAIQVDAMADEILRLRATLAQRREGVIAVCAHCGVSVGSDRTIEDGIVTHSRKETCISLLKSQRADRDALATAQREAAGKDAEIKRRDEILRAVEWSGRLYLGEVTCPYCGNAKRRGHVEGCEFSTLTSAPEAGR